MSRVPGETDADANTDSRGGYGDPRANASSSLDAPWGVGGGGGEMPAEAEGEQAEAADAHVKTLAQDAGERTAVWNNWIRGIHPSTISRCQFGRSLVPD